MQAPTGSTEKALSTSLAKTAKGKATISAHRSRSKMLKTLRRSASQRQPKGLHVLRSSFGRRMNKFVRPSPERVSIFPGIFRRDEVRMGYRRFQKFMTRALSGLPDFMGTRPSDSN